MYLSNIKCTFPLMIINWLKIGPEQHSLGIYNYTKMDNFLYQ